MFEFIAANEIHILRWLHILAMVYWLGGEWGVFTSSRCIANPRLPLDERQRHMETAYRIDILARIGIILLLPLGLHMGNLYGIQPLGGGWLVGMWLATALWLSITISAFVYRGTDLGIRLTQIDEWVRYIVIPLLLIFSLWSLFGGGPFGAHWYSVKVGLYGILLVMGLGLRVIMRRWVGYMRDIAAESANAAHAEVRLDKELGYGRTIAYFYWIGIATVAFFGAVKPIV